MKKISAERALTTEGWVSGITIGVGDDGRIETISMDKDREAYRAGILIPAPANLHSHSFQRAMAGLTEYRGSNARDSFWTWRSLMYRFLDQLTPDHIQSIAAFAQMQMLEAGFSAVAEFHYLHHQPDGTHYEDIAETSKRIAAAALDTGIGLTLLPVLYEHGGCDQRPLEAGQRRFGANTEIYRRLFEGASAATATLPRDAQIGVAAHSLRAVSPESLSALALMASDKPIHIHIAEQMAEVDEVKSDWGMRPVEWLLANNDVDHRWCLVHATQMESKETVALAKTGAVAGLCPITECNLGDGIFDGARHLQNNGKFGIGTDSNIRISFSEELRLLEYSQRLRDNARAVLATPEKSVGRVLHEGAARGGAQATGRNSGVIDIGFLADFISLDVNAIDLAGKEGDDILDSYIFVCGDHIISDVWSAGRHMVKNGHHVKRNNIIERYRKTIQSLQAIV